MKRLVLMTSALVALAACTPSGDYARTSTLKSTATYLQCPKFATPGQCGGGGFDVARPADDVSTPETPAERPSQPGNDVTPPDDGGDTNTPPDSPEEPPVDPEDPPTDPEEPPEEDDRGPKGNASANNGKGGNYDRTGHEDNGRGNGKGRR